MYEIEQMNHQDKINLTFSLMNIMESWKVSDKEQMCLLNLPDSFKARNLYLYRQGDKAFDYTQNMMTCAQMLMGIHAALGTTYPTNQDYGAIWLKRPMKKFDKQTPLALMLSGKTGMRRIWHFLDCTQSWN